MLILSWLKWAVSSFLFFRATSLRHRYGCCCLVAPLLLLLLVIGKSFVRNNWISSSVLVSSKRLFSDVCLIMVLCISMWLLWLQCEVHLLAFSAFRPSLCFFVPKRSDCYWLGEKSVLRLFWISEDNCKYYFFCVHFDAFMLLSIYFY